jgi:hypothetical protein
MRGRTGPTGASGPTGPAGGGGGDTGPTGPSGIIFGDTGTAQFVSSQLFVPGFGGIFTQGTGATGNTLTLTDRRNITPFVVSNGSLPNDPGEYSTISAALTAAAAAVVPNTTFPLVYVKQGIYTESFTLPEGIFLLGENNCGIFGTVTVQPGSGIVPFFARGISFV